MPEKIKIWSIGPEDTLSEIQTSKLNQELRIQNWVEKDVGIISNNLLVIGREVETAYGGFIDILCIDNKGDLVVIELKRDMTLREVTAQALDYASWVQVLSANEITEIADIYLKDKGGLEKAFQDKFGIDLPEVLNANHRMMIIGSRIDASTQRIMNYLSESYGVGINAITFTFYEQNGKEYLSRNQLIEEDEAAAQQARHSLSKRKPPLSMEELRESLQGDTLKKLFDHAVEKFLTVFNGRHSTRSTVSFTGEMNGSVNTIMAIEPFNSSEEQGLSFYFYAERFSLYFNKDEESIDIIFANKLTKDRIWNVDDGARRGFFTSTDMIDSIIGNLREP